MGSPEPPAASTDPLTTSRLSARRIAFFVTVAAGSLIALVLVLAVVDVLRIRHDIRSGQETLTRLDFATVDKAGGLLPIAQQAQRELHRAADRARSSPWLGMLSHLPVVGGQIKAARELTQTVDQVGTLGASTASDVQAALDRAAGAGPSGRVQLIDDVSAATVRLQGALRAVSVKANGWLVPPLAGARADLVRELQKADGRLDDGRVTLHTLHDFLVGPRRYLILGGNNAEMRSVGIATTSGISLVQNGEVQVGPFVEASESAIPRPGVPLPEGWEWLFGYLDPGIAYSNVVASPNFPLSGEVAARIAAKNKFHAVDGVIYVDTVALARLLAVVGPVTVDDVTYDVTNAVQILNNRDYLTFDPNDPTARRGAQGRVAKAIFDALNTRQIPLVKLAAALQGLATRRHLLAWSSKPEEEQLWHDVGADGTRSDHDVLVAAEDLGASKLDYYVTEKVTMNVRSASDGRRVDMSISITNPTRTESSPYIDGGSIFAKPGEYGVYLVVYLPADTFAIDHPDPSWTSWSRDGPLQATTFTTRVPMGSTRTVKLSFSLPPSVDHVNVVPSARVVPVPWTFNGRHFNDGAPTLIDLRSIPTGEPPPLPGWMLTGLLLFALGAALTGDAWGRRAVAADEGVVRRARVDANLGWWLMVVGVAMIAAQIAIYARW